MILQMSDKYTIRKFPNLNGKPHLWKPQQTCPWKQMISQYEAVPDMALTFGGPVMLESSTVITLNSHDRLSTDTLLKRAEVWSTAVRKPVGKV